MIAFTFISCDEPEAPHEHKWDEGEITTVATCTKEGIKTYKCSCGETKTEEIPALGHTEVVDSAVDPTCTEKGKTEGKHCSVCNVVLVAQEEVAALGHIVDDGTCTRCNTTGLVAAKVGETEYASLAKAINEAPSGATVLLLSDASGNGLSSADGTQLRESLTIDFAGHTYTMTKVPVGSVGYESQSMHWGKSLGLVTMKNGFFKVANDVSEMAMQNHTNFIGENMHFDFSNIKITTYESTYGAYAGYEVPLFNNNKEVMTLKNCTVIMPKDSTKGVSADGKSVTLEDTVIDGYINLQDDTSILYVKGNTTFKDVIAYFDGRTIEKITDEGVTTYKLKATE
mgnify:CR=1 FL=1